jgi:hypothetical protein
VSRSRPCNGRWSGGEGGWGLERSGGGGRCGPLLCGTTVVLCTRVLWEPSLAVTATRAPRVRRCGHAGGDVGTQAGGSNVMPAPQLQGVQLAHRSCRGCGRALKLTTTSARLPAPFGSCAAPGAAQRRAGSDMARELSIVDVRAEVKSARARGVNDYSRRAPAGLRAPRAPRTRPARPPRGCPVGRAAEGVEGSRARAPQARGSPAALWRGGELGGGLREALCAF